MAMPEMTKNLLFVAPTGVGKTVGIIVSLKSIRRLYPDKNYFAVIVAPPVLLMYNLFQQCLEKGLNPVIYSGKLSENSQITYDTAVVFVQIMDILAFRTYAMTSVSLLCRIKFIAVDEAHLLKSWEFREDVKRTDMLSGGIFNNIPKVLISSCVRPTEESLIFSTLDLNVDSTIVMRETRYMGARFFIEIQSSSKNDILRELLKRLKKWIQSGISVSFSHRCVVFFPYKDEMETYRQAILSHLVADNAPALCSKEKSHVYIHILLSYFHTFILSYFHTFIPYSFILSYFHTLVFYLETLSLLLLSYFATFTLKSSSLSHIHTFIVYVILSYSHTFIIS
jgi:DEAD/DEAH box helicase